MEKMLLKHPREEIKLQQITTWQPWRYLSCAPLQYSLPLILVRTRKWQKRLGVFANKRQVIFSLLKFLFINLIACRKWKKRQPHPALSIGSHMRLELDHLHNGKYLSNHMLQTNLTWLIDTFFMWSHMHLLLINLCPNPAFIK